MVLYIFFSNLLKNSTFLKKWGGKLLEQKLQSVVNNVWGGGRCLERASTAPRRPAVWEVAGDECGLSLNLFYEVCGGKCVFPRPTPPRTSKSSVIEIFPSLFCKLCGLWLKILSRNCFWGNTHTRKLAHKQSRSFGFIIMNWIKDFGRLQIEKLVWAFLCFIFHRRFGWNLFFLPFCTSPSSPRPTWLAFHAEARLKLELFEYLEKTKQSQLRFLAPFTFLGTLMVVTPETVTGRVKPGLISFPGPDHGWGQSVYECFRNVMKSQSGCANISPNDNIAHNPRMNQQASSIDGRVWLSVSVL